MRPGDILFLNGRAFRFDTSQDDGYVLFLRAYDEDSKHFAEEAQREGRWFLLESAFASTEGQVTALREAKDGALRVRLELRESAASLSTAWPHQS